MKNISHHSKLLKNSTLLPGHLENGQKQVKLNISGQMKLEEESIMSMTSNESLVLKKLNKKNKQFVMQESVPIIKKKTLIDKSISLKRNILMQKQSKTLVQDSIGRDTDLTPFWNKSTKDLSSKLWLPIKTEYVDLASNYLNGSSKNLMLNSWYSTKVLTKQTSLESSQMTSLLSLQSSLRKTTELDQENLSVIESHKKKHKDYKKQLFKRSVGKLKHSNHKQKNTRDYKKQLFKRSSGKLKHSKHKQKNTKEAPGKSKLIRFYPDTEQKTLINRCFGTRRFVYNKALYLIKKKLVKATLKDLRKLCINNINFEKQDKWMLDIEYDVRDEALRDLLKNIESNQAKGGKFEMKYLKKNTRESISVLKKKWNKNNNWYSKIFKVDNINSSETLPKILKHDSRLKKTSLGKYYFCIPQPLELKSENQAAKNQMIFIDPGVKTFMTGYDPSGKIIIWGERDICVIARLLHYQSKLQSRITKQFKYHKRHRMKKAFLRISNRIYNLTNELHKKLTKWLLENYEYIFIPRLNFHKLNKKSKMKMARYRHCAFLDRLLFKSREYIGSKVFEINEAYTSKTCSRCGNQHSNLSNKDIYNCSNCKLSIGRDINASKNVLLRYFSKRDMTF